LPRITKVYTRTGDDGTTALGTGQRVSKSSLRIAAYGAVDELNAQIGVVLAASVTSELVEPLKQVQNDLFHMGAELCIPDAERDRHPRPRIESRHTAVIEELADKFNGELPALKNFVLPGGSPAAAHLQLARTVCRRVERDVVLLAAEEHVGPDVIKYLNRLSDLLFVMARFENKRAGVDEPTWDSRA